MGKSNGEVGPSSGPSTPSKIRNTSNQVSPDITSYPVRSTPRAPTPATGIIVDDERDTKEREIHTCLNDPLNEGIDLRRLRQLAVSQGGLKSLALRKQAWPKLVAAHEVLWNAVRKTSLDDDSFYSSKNLKTIQKLARRVKWSKHQITKSPKTFDELLGLVLSAKSPTVAPPTSSLIDESFNQTDIAELSNGPPPIFGNRIRRVSFDLSLDDIEEEADETTSRAWARRKEKERLRQLAQDERQVLRKLMLHLQRSHPDFECYDGLQNLLAVLWIVLESPSLTSVTSLQLVQYQWQRPGGHENDDDDLFLQVLLSWDRTLYDHFRTLGYEHTPDCISKSWIPHWFSQDLKDLGILLRIWDLLIVSPPTAIVYFSVALAVYFRDPLLRANQRPIFEAILEHLPGDGLEKYDTQIVENILENCLRGMEDCPLPPTFPMPLSPSRRKRELVPKWFTAPTAPTDSQALERLRQLRQERIVHEGDRAAEMQDFEPLPPPSIVNTSTTATPRAFQIIAMETYDGTTFRETPNTTPCSTPESVAEIEKAMSTMKFWRPLLSKMNWWYQSEKRGVAYTVLLVVLIIFGGLYRSDDAQTTIGIDGPIRGIKQSPIESNDFLDGLAIGLIPTKLSSEHEFASATDANLEIIMRQDSHPGTPTWRLSGEKHETDTISPARSENDLFLQSLRKEQLGHPSPLGVSVEVVGTEHDVVDSSHRTLDDLNTETSAYAPDCFLEDDGMETHPSPVPTRDLEASEKGYERNSRNNDGLTTSAMSKVLVGIGHFVLQSSKTQLEARSETLQVLEAARSQSITTLNRASVESQVALGIAFEEGRKRVENISKTLQTQQDMATEFALEATKARLEASLVARDHANLAALTVISTSRNVTKVGLEHAYALLLSATNTSLNVAGNGLRGLGRNGQRAKRAISTAIDRTESGAVRLGKGTIAGAMTICQKSLKLSRGISSHFRGRTLEATIAVRGTGSTIYHRTKRIGSIVQNSTFSMARAVGHGASSIGTTLKRGKRKAGKLGLRSLQRTLHTGKSTLSLVTVGARMTVKGMGKGIQDFHEGRKGAFISASRISRTSIDLLVHTGDGIIIGATRRINGVNYRRKQSARFILNSGRTWMARSREGARVLSQISRCCDNGMRNASTYALLVGKKTRQHGASLVNEYSRSAFGTFANSCKRAYNLGLVSTNSTLNAIGHLCRHTGRRTIAGSRMASRGVAKALQLVLGSVRRGQRIVRKGSNAVFDAFSNTSKALLNTIDRARQVSLQAGRHSVVKSVEVLLHGANAGAATLAYFTNTSYGAAIITTNTTLNVLGRVAKAIGKVSNAGGINLNRTLRGGSKFSIRAVDQCSRVVQFGVQSCWATTLLGMTTAAKQGREAFMAYGTFGKRALESFGQTRKRVSVAIVQTGERLLASAESGARASSHGAMLAANTTLNLVGTQTVLVATRTKRGFDILSQAASLASGVVAKSMRRNPHSLWMGMRRGLPNTGVGIAQLADAVGKSSQVARFKIVQSGANSVVAFTGTNGRLAGLTRKIFLPLCPLFAETAIVVGQASLQGFMDFSNRAGPDHVQLAKESNEVVRRDALDLAESTLGNVLSFAVALRSRLGAVAAFFMPKMREFILGAFHIARQANSAILAAVVVAYGFASAIVLEVVKAIVDASLRGMDLAEDLGIAVRTVVSEAPRKAALVVSSASTAIALEMKNIIVDGSLHGLDLAEELAIVVKSIVSEAPRKAALAVSCASPTIRNISMLSRPIPVLASDATTTKVPTRGTSRRVRGAGDLAREFLQNNMDSNFEHGKELSVMGNRLSKHTNAIKSIHRLTLVCLDTQKEVSEVLRCAAAESMDAIIGSLTQGALIIEIVAQKSLLSIHQRVQATVGRTKELVRLCMFTVTAVGEATSRFLDNLALHGQYALFTMELSLEDKRGGFIRLVQEVDRILALRRARELALIVLYNLLLMTIVFVDVGKNELHRSSERNISAVLQVNSEAWGLIQQAAELHIDRMKDARQAILDTLAKAKRSLLGRFRRNGG